MILTIEYRTKDGTLHKYSNDVTDSLNDLLSQNPETWEVSQFVEDTLESMYYAEVKDLSDLLEIVWAGVDE